MSDREYPPEPAPASPGGASAELPPLLPGYVWALTVTAEAEVIPGEPDKPEEGS